MGVNQDIACVERSREVHCEYAHYAPYSVGFPQAVQQSFAPLHHYDMITKTGLDLNIFRTRSRARLQLERRLFECSIEVASLLPSQRAT